MAQNSHKKTFGGLQYRLHTKKTFDESWQRSHMETPVFTWRLLSQCKEDI